MQIFNFLKNILPKLKIVARGNTLKAYGDEELLEEFDRRLTMLINHFGKYNKLDENVIERVLTSQSSDDYSTSKSSGEVLAHGVGGKRIKAQSINQRKISREHETKTIWYLLLVLQALEKLM